MGRWSDPRVDYVTSGRRCPHRRVISGEEGWPWVRSRVGKSWFATASCELLTTLSRASPRPAALSRASPLPAALSRASPLPAALSSPVLENQEGR